MMVLKVFALLLPLLLLLVLLPPLSLIPASVAAAASSPTTTPSVATIDEVQLSMDGTMSSSCTATKTSASVAADNDFNRNNEHDNKLEYEQKYHDDDESKEEGKEDKEALKEVEDDHEHDEEEVEDDEDNWDRGEDMGVMQDYDEDHMEAIYEKIQEARHYMETHAYTVYTNHPKNKSTTSKDSRMMMIQSHCRNQHASCAFWSVMNQCQDNVLYMNATCAPMCAACDSLLLEIRCPLDPHATNAFQPGDLNRMFERIVTHLKFVKYQPHVLSRPIGLSTGEEEDDTVAAATASASSLYQRGPPWMIALDKFLSDEEVNVLIELSHQEVYQRSYRVNSTLQWNGSLDTYHDETRTSSSVYCQSKTCMNNDTTRIIMERMEEITSIPQRHYQHLQFIRYEPGQHFVIHNDYIPYQRHRQQGARVFTIFFI